MYLALDVFLEKENIDPSFMYLVVKINLFFKIRKYRPRFMYLVIKINLFFKKGNIDQVF